MLSKVSLEKGRSHVRRLNQLAKRHTDKIIVDVQCTPNNGILPTIVHYQVYGSYKGQKSILCHDINVMTDLGETEALLLQLYLVVRIAHDVMKRNYFQCDTLELCIHNFAAFLVMTSQVSYLNDICKEQHRLVRNLAAVLGFSTLEVTYPEVNNLPTLVDQVNNTEGICSSRDLLGMDTMDTVELSLKIRRSLYEWV